MTKDEQRIADRLFSPLRRQEDWLAQVLLITILVVVVIEMLKYVS